MRLKPRVSRKSFHMKHLPFLEPWSNAANHHTNSVIISSHGSATAATIVPTSAKITT